MSGNNFNFDYDFPEFEFDPAEIPDSQLEHIQNEIGNREEIISNLRRQVIEWEGERNELQNAVERLRTENVDLQEKVRKLQSERSTSRAQDVFADFSKAVEGVETDLAGSRFRLDDLQVEMKANVLQDEEGMKFHLPGLDEDFAAENLSTLNFKIAPSAEDSDSDSPAPRATYEPIPDLRGMAVDRARVVIQREGFSVGVVEPGSDAESGVVVDQFPSPQSVAEPETEIDLTVSWDEPDEEDSEDTTDSEDSTDSRTDPNREPLESRLPALEEINGIGPTYAERLQSRGIESILDLSDTDPETAATIAHTSMSRAKSWVEQANLIVRDITQ